MKKPRRIILIEKEIVKRDGDCVRIESESVDIKSYLMNTIGLETKLVRVVVEVLD